MLPDATMLPAGTVSNVLRVMRVPTHMASKLKNHSIFANIDRTGMSPAFQFNGHRVTNASVHAVNPLLRNNFDRPAKLPTLATSPRDRK